MTRESIGVQLYTLREATKTDMVGTLQRVARIGYGAVEFAGWGNATPAEVRRALDATGILAIAIHVPWERWEGDRDAALAECREIGCEWAVLPSVPAPQLADVAAVRRLAARVEEFAAAARDAGLRFAFHNHATELVPTDGTTPWHVVLEETSAHVDFEVDLYWAAYAGADPAAVLRAAAGRVPLVHAKDIDLPSKADAPVGEGDLLWPEILATARETGVRWHIVEQDTPGDPFRDVETALRNLRRLLDEARNR